MRERARETDRQSDGDDSSYCVFIVSSMYNKAKTKYMCGSYYMVLKNRVGR